MPTRRGSDDEGRVLVRRGRPRDDVRHRARVRDVAIRRGHERLKLGVLDRAVAVDVGGAEQARHHLVREHAGLHDRPLVGLLIDGRGEDHADVRVLAERRGLEDRLHLGGGRGDAVRGGLLVEEATAAAHADDAARVTRVDDHVGEARRHPAEHVVVERRLGQRTVEQREERLALIVEGAVAAEHEVQDRADRRADDRLAS